MLILQAMGGFQRRRKKRRMKKGIFDARSGWNFTHAQSLNFRCEVTHTTYHENEEQKWKEYYTEYDIKEQKTNRRKRMLSVRAVPLLTLDSLGATKLLLGRNLTSHLGRIWSMRTCTWSHLVFRFLPRFFPGFHGSYGGREVVD